MKYFITLKAEDISILLIMNLMEILNGNLTENQNQRETNKLSKVLYDEINENDNVEYNVEDGKKGLNAVSVKVI